MGKVGQSTQLDGKGQKAYWEQIRNARFQYLERLANTKVGVLYIRKGETERQARRRILDRECLSVGLDPKQFKQLLDSKRKPSLHELKGKQGQGTS